MRRAAVIGLTVYALKRRVGGWRGLSALAVALFPSLVALIYVSFVPLDDPATPRPFEFFGGYVALLSHYFVLPFVSMVVMLPALGEFYEKGSICYLLTRPAPRSLHVLGLYLGGLLATVPFLALSAWLPGMILFSGSSGIEIGFWLSRMVWLTLILWLGAATYGALCVFLGVWSKKAFLWAIGLLFGLGSIAGSITGPLRDLSPHRYLAALYRDRLDVVNQWGMLMVPDPDPPSVSASVLYLVVAAVVFLVLGGWAIRRRDVL